MGSYSFTVTDLEWPSEAIGLPNNAVVYLSKNLVDSDPVIDIEWENAVNKELSSRYGISALRFNFEPTDLGDFECLVRDLERIDVLGKFRNVENDELLFHVDDNKKGHLALECITRAIDEFDEAECKIVKISNEGLHALIVLQGDIDNLGSDILNKWEFCNDDTDGDFYEHVDAGMVVERLRGDAFHISEIVWMSPSEQLPHTTVVHLPDGLVCAQDYKSGGERNREINDQLQAKYGVRAQSFTFRAFAMNSYLISAKDLDGEDLTWVVHAPSPDVALVHYQEFLKRFFDDEELSVDGPITVRMLLPAGGVERVVDWEEMPEIDSLS